MMNELKRLTTVLGEMGLEGISHSGKTYLGHLVNVYRLMEAQDCPEDLCRAGMFHSIYGTQQFQGFKLGLERRGEVRVLIGERAERFAYLNCAVDRPTLDAALGQSEGPFLITDRLSGEQVPLSRAEFDDLCTVHLYDWLEQAPRSRLGWDYRRAAYRRMAERLGERAVAAYKRVFAQEPSARPTTAP
jgi:hypothetical protein